MTSLFSTENLEFDPAKSVSINEVNSTFTEQSLHPLFGKGPLGGQATAAIARQQAREAVFMQRFSDMDIDKFQQVPQDDGDVWLVGMQTIDGEQHHVHISQNSLLDSVQLVEATAAEVALREKKYKIVTDEMSIEIDGKRYFVDSHIPFNFGFGGVTTQSTGTRNAFIDGASLRHPPPTPDPSPPQAGGGAKLHALFQSQIQNSAFLV